MYKLRHILFALCLVVAGPLCAQELRCNVMVNHDQVQGANQQNFQQLQQAITEMLNNTKWTNLTFAEQERIECNVQITCKQVSEDNLYLCEATFQASRPVYGTSYTTPLLNVKDNQFNFVWALEPLNFQLSTFQSNLPSMLAYYAYLILGYDADSFQRLGGSPYFQVCESIVTLCQTATMDAQEQKGWQAFERNPNRYTLTNNLTDEAFSSLRQYYYDYHRLGLDEMEANVGNGRSRIVQGLPTLTEAKKARMNSYVLSVFLDTKVEELINILQGATEQEKTTSYDLLISLDPTRTNQYDRINE